MTKPESWVDVFSFTESFPDTAYWNRWRTVMQPVLRQSMDAGYDKLFRAGSSMHDMVFSTIDHNDVRKELRVTLSVTPEFLLRVSYSDRHNPYAASLESVALPPQEVFPVLSRSLRHLWEETMPEPIPEVLRRG